MEKNGLWKYICEENLKNTWGNIWKLLFHFNWGRTFAICIDGKKEYLESKKLFSWIQTEIPNPNSPFTACDRITKWLHWWSIGEGILGY